MENTFEFYRDFLNLDEANAFVSMLDANNIEHSLESSDTVIDKAIVGNGFIPKAVLKIKNDDFQKVNALISYEIASGEYSDYADHYLNDFETEELKGIFEKPEDWTTEDAGISRIILRERGVEMSTKDIKAKKQARLEEIRKGQRGNRLSMALYAFGISFGLILNLFLLIAGIGMAYYYSFGKATDMVGQKYFVYDTQTRKNGKIILYVGGAILVIELILLQFVDFREYVDQFYFRPFESF
ncbi:MAG: hypothetical protein ACI85O_002817 [Saprospiraceae bacterium]|jgi:hypothetical protein